MTLLETYQKRLSVSKDVFAKAHDGAELSKDRQIMVATMLDNTNRFLNEAFSNSVGTQRSDLGAYKKFCL